MLLTRFTRFATRPSVTFSRTLSSLERYKTLCKEDASKILLGAKEKSSLTFKDLSEKLQVNKVWLTAAIHGEHPIDSELSARLFQALNITGSSEELRSLSGALSRMPTSRGASNNGKDPAVRRLQELVDVYGKSITTLIREEVGDGIVSAIDCTIQLENESVQKKDGQKEVRFTLKVDGKFLPYKVDHSRK